MKAELMKRWRERTDDGGSVSISTPSIAFQFEIAALAEMVIDIVADARELERGATMAELLSRSGLLESAPYGGPEVYTDERKVAAVEALERFDADTRQHAGFAMTTELTGSIERTSVTITAEFIEGLWMIGDHVVAHPFTGSSIDGALDHGTVGRFALWGLTDGTVWASSEGLAVMVVKPDPELSSLGG